MKQHLLPLLDALKKLTPGILLILAAAFLLLVTDRMHRTVDTDKLPHIAIFQFSSRPLLDDAVAGAMQ